MSTVSTWLHEEDNEDSLAASYGRRDVNRELRMRRHAFERRSARPRSVNGIHRRRNKRYSW